PKASTTRFLVTTSRAIAKRVSRSTTRNHYQPMKWHESGLACQQSSADERCLGVRPPGRRELARSTRTVAERLGPGKTALPLGECGFHSCSPRGGSWPLGQESLASDGGAHAAVDQDVGAVHEAGFRGEQERDDRGDLVGPALPAERGQLHELGHGRV